MINFSKLEKDTDESKLNPFDIIKMALKIQYITTDIQ